MDELLDNCIINSEKLKDVIASPELDFRSIQSIIIL